MEEVADLREVAVTFVALPAPVLKTVHSEVVEAEMAAASGLTQEVQLFA